MTSVPRIIHQTWKDRNIPPEYEAFHQSVKKHHPEWEHRLWTDVDNRELIRREFNWFLPAYDGYRHHIERVDAVRYFILLRYGGVYLDLDMECLMPLDGLFDRPGRPYFGLLALPSIKHVVTGNAFMASPPAHPFFVFLTRRLANFERDITHQDVFQNTGPERLSAELRAFSALSGYETLGLDVVCDRGVLHENPATAGHSLEDIRRKGLLHLVHHHTNSWNRQFQPPDPVPEGFTLLPGCDIPGHDIDYVESGTAAMAETCRNNTAAVAFNFNGYIKGSGRVGRTAGSSAQQSWLKPGIQPWVCVKSVKLGEVGGNQYLSGKKQSGDGCG